MVTQSMVDLLSSLPKTNILVEAGGAIEIVDLMPRVIPTAAVDAGLNGDFGIQGSNRIVLVYKIDAPRAYVTRMVYKGIGSVEVTSDVVLGAEKGKPAIWPSAPNVGASSPRSPDVMPQSIAGSVNNAARISGDFFSQLVTSGTRRDLAALVLCPGVRLEAMWTVSLRDLFEFLREELSPQVPKELRDFSWAMFDIVRPAFPQSCSNFLSRQALSCRDIDSAEGVSVHGRSQKNMRATGTSR